MSRTTNANYKLGPFKWTVSGVSAGAAIAGMIFIALLGLALVILAFWMFIHNFMLIAAGDFTWINVLWILLSGMFLVNSAASSNSD